MVKLSRFCSYSERPATRLSSQPLLFSYFGLKFYSFTPTRVRILKVLLSGVRNYRLIQYADDTIFILDGSRNSLEDASRILNVFKLCSGLTVILDKCNLFPLGPYINRQPAFIKNIVIYLSLGPVTMLGITFTNDGDDLLWLNSLPKLSRLNS